MDNYFWIGLSIFILLDLIILFFVLARLKKRGFSSADKEVFRRHWKTIRSETDGKHAVMDADKLLDVVLAKKGYTGSLGNKLQAAKQIFSDVDGVWSAHKLRNQLAHELNRSPDDRETRRALGQFEKALRDLGIF